MSAIKDVTTPYGKGGLELTKTKSVYICIISLSLQPCQYKINKKLFYKNYDINMFDFSDSYIEGIRCLGNRQIILQRRITIIYYIQSCNRFLADGVEQ